MWKYRIKRIITINIFKFKIEYYYLIQSKKYFMFSKWKTIVMYDDIYSSENNFNKINR